MTGSPAEIQIFAYHFAVAIATTNIIYAFFFYYFEVVIVMRRTVI